MMEPLTAAPIEQLTTVFSERRSMGEWVWLERWTWQRVTREYRWSQWSKLDRADCWARIESVAGDTMIAVRNMKKDRTKRGVVGPDTEQLVERLVSATRSKRKKPVYEQQFKAGMELDGSVLQVNYAFEIEPDGTIWWTGDLFPDTIIATADSTRSYEAQLLDLVMQSGWLTSKGGGDGTNHIHVDSNSSVSEPDSRQ